MTSEHSTRQAAHKVRFAAAPPDSKWCDGKEAVVRGGGCAKLCMQQAGLLNVLLRPRLQFVGIGGLGLRISMRHCPPAEQGMEGGFRFHRYQGHLDGGAIMDPSANCKASMLCTWGSATFSTTPPRGFGECTTSAADVT